MASRRSFVLAITALLAMVTPGAAQVDVRTQHNDNNRTGAQLAETTLVPEVVADPNRFGKLFSYKVEGHVYAQPLYLANVQLASTPGAPPQTKNLLLVATMHNKVYAFDADEADPSKQLIWRRDLGTAVDLDDLKGDLEEGDNYKNILDSVGIASTPVISRNRDAQQREIITLYVVVLHRIAGRSVHVLHALDVLNSGQETMKGPVPISAIFFRPGVNQPMKFNSSIQLQRPALLLLPVETVVGRREKVIVAFGSYGDKRDKAEEDIYHGWVFSYDASDLLKDPGVFASDNVNVQACDGGASTEGKAGIWQAGQGPAGDDRSGNIYFMTGNGAFDPHSGTAGRWALGNSVVHLGPDLGLQSWFSPSNNCLLDVHDVDLGSAGGLLIPDTDRLVGGGKEGRLFVLLRSSLGGFQDACGAQPIQHFQATGLHNSHGDLPPALEDYGRRFGVGALDDLVQRLFQEGKHLTDSDPAFHLHGSPVYWRSDREPRVYLWAENDWLRAYTFENGRFPVSRDLLYPDPKVVFGNDFLREGPALTAVPQNSTFPQPELVITFTGTGGTIGPTPLTRPGFVNVMRSTNGQCFRNKVVLDANHGFARSRHQPGIAFGNNEAIVAWTNDEGHPSVLRTNDLVQFGPKAELRNEESDFGAAIAFLNGRFYLAWTGTDQHLNIMSSTSGLNYSSTSKVTLANHVTAAAPRLAAFNGRLYVSYRGTNLKLFVVELLPTQPRVTEGRTACVDERSDFAPALAQDTHSARVYLTWIGRQKLGIFDLDRRLNAIAWPDINSLFSDPGGCSPQGGRKQVLFDTSRAGPTLTMFNDQLYVGWAGTDEHPDVAALLHPEAVTGKIAAPKGMPGAFLSLSANGLDPRTGIVWASLPRDADANDATVSGVLRAFDASTLEELWNSQKCRGGRDRVGDFAKFVAPTVANGKVYLATFSGEVQVYGMNPPAPCRP